MQETPVRFLGRKVPLEEGWATHSSILGLPWWLRCKEFACNVGDQGSIPGLVRSPGGGHGNPQEHSCLENPMDRRAWGLQCMGSQRVGHDRETKHMLKSSLLKRQKAIIIIHTCQINKFSKTLKRKKKPQTVIV